MLTLNSLIFNGIDAVPIQVQIQATPGLQNKDEFKIVGLADKAVTESRERVTNALSSMNMAMPSKKVTVNLTPADLEKSGAHFDLPILCGILAIIGVLPADELSKYIIIGEIGLDGSLQKTGGVLPAAIYAHQNNMGIICPAPQGGEARWSGNTDILAPVHILDLINHFKGTQVLPMPDAAKPQKGETVVGCMSEVKAQESAKRALEIAAAGGHAMLMCGPPGSGKTMIASRLPGILPALSPAEILESSMIYSVAGQLDGRALISERPFRSVHHTASAVALSGGGTMARPGEISLAHNGVLFLDELPEFQRQSLEILRQPMEQNKIMISRAKRTATYPARFQLIAAMNPCPCGHLGNAKLSCSLAPRCAEKYQNKISGPLLDRIDIHVDVDGVNPWEMSGDNMPSGESSDVVRARVVAAREKQITRSMELFGREILNAHLEGKELDTAIVLSGADTQFLNTAAEKMGLSARGYIRIKRVARTIADLRGAANVEQSDLAEALSYRPTRRGGV